MKITYDQRADALYIQFQEGTVGKTKNIEEGILIDVNEDGILFGIEIIGVSERMPVKTLGNVHLELPIATPELPPDQI